MVSERTRGTGLPRWAQEDHEHPPIDKRVFTQTQWASDRDIRCKSSSTRTAAYGSVSGDLAYRHYPRSQWATNQAGGGYSASVQPGWCLNGRESDWPLTARLRATGVNLGKAEVPYSNTTRFGMWVADTVAGANAEAFSSTAAPDWLDFVPSRDMIGYSGGIQWASRWMALGIPGGTVAAKPFPRELWFGWKTTPEPWIPIQGKWDTGLLWSPGDLVIWDMTQQNERMGWNHEVYVQHHQSDLQMAQWWCPDSYMPSATPQSWSWQVVVPAYRFWPLASDPTRRWKRTESQAVVTCLPFDWGDSKKVALSWDVDPTPHKVPPGCLDQITPFYYDVSAQTTDEWRQSARGAVTRAGASAAWKENLLLPTCSDLGSVRFVFGCGLIATPSPNPPHPDDLYYQINGTYIGNHLGRRNNSLASWVPPVNRQLPLATGIALTGFGQAGGDPDDSAFVAATVVNSGLVSPRPFDTIDVTEPLPWPGRQRMEMLVGWWVQPRETSTLGVYSFCQVEVWPSNIDGTDNPPDYGDAGCWLNMHPLEPVHCPDPAYPYAYPCLRSQSQSWPIAVGNDLVVLRSWITDGQTFPDARLDVSKAIKPLWRVMFVNAIMNSKPAPRETPTVYFYARQH